MKVYIKKECIAINGERSLNFQITFLLKVHKLLRFIALVFRAAVLLIEV